MIASRALERIPLLMRPFAGGKESDPEKEQAKEKPKLTPEGELQVEPEEEQDKPEDAWGSDTSRSVKTYDFAYEGGRWVLKTSDLEEGVRLAFEYALKSQ